MPSCLHAVQVRRPLPCGNCRRIWRHPQCGRKAADPRTGTVAPDICMMPGVCTMKNIQQELPLQEMSHSEQAAAWFLRRQEGGCSEAERQEFEAWLAASATHRSEYQQYVQLWH